jgi:hypothetical protein
MYWLLVDLQKAFVTTMSDALKKKRSKDGHGLHIRNGERKYEMIIR